MKLIHLKSQTSVALPIYTSDLSLLTTVKGADKQAQTPKEKVCPQVFVLCFRAGFVEMSKVTRL